MFGRETDKLANQNFFATGKILTGDLQFADLALRLSLLLYTSVHYFHELNKLLEFTKP